MLVSLAPRARTISTSPLAVCSGAETQDSRLTGKQKELISRNFAEPSDGLEPSTPSLPCALFGNWSQPAATVLA